MSSVPRIYALFVALFFSMTALSIPSTSWAEVIDEGAQEQSRMDMSWWSPRYLVDYGLVVGGIAGYVIGEDITPRQQAMIGPSYDPTNPVLVFESQTVGKTHLEERVEETVPTVWIHRLVAMGGFFVAGLEGAELAAGGGSAHEFHEAFVGYAETVAITATITSMTKPFVGRLRPDFGERALRYHCTWDDQADQYGAYCDGYRDHPLGDSREEGLELIDDGQRSFISGHSSHSFNIFGYTALLVGGRYVWGQDASTTSRGLGIATQAAMLGTATFIAGSRVYDGRHHVSDTVVGTVVGLGIANASYWRRFHRDGSLRQRSGDASTTSASLSAQPTAHGPTLSIAIQF